MSLYKGNNLIAGNPVIDQTVISNSNHAVSGGAVKSYVDENISRRNLLDNAYFVGGGSQQDREQFPINQRGGGTSQQTIYSGNTTYFDRWHGSANISAIIEEDGVTISSSAASGGVSFSQRMYLEPLLGKTVTGSVLTADGTLYTGTGTLPTTVPTSGNTYAFSVNTSVGGFQLAYVSARQTLEFTLTLPGAGRSIKLAAAKLEIGETQTLAHNEGTTANPVWVLNEIPRYDEELRRCQAWLNIFDVGVIGSGFMNASTVAICEIPTPVSMRPIAANTDISFSGTLQVLGGGTVVNATAAKIHSVNKGGVSLSITVPTGISAFQPVSLAISANSSILLSAEL